MKLFNMHTHTVNSHDGKQTADELCRTAIQNGLMGIAITDHCDCEFSDDPKVFSGVTNSFEDSKAMKARYDGTLTVAAGVELGEAIYAPGFAKKITAAHPWDVILGSVHAVRVAGWDMPFSTIDFSDKDEAFIKAYLTQYFEDMKEMLLTVDFDVLSHLTVPIRYICRKYGKPVDITEYYAQIEEILTLTKQKNKTLEINTSECRNGTDFFMPDENILDMYLSLGGKNITVGSDAHSVDRVSSGLKTAAEMLLNKNIATLTYYINRKPIEYSIR